VQKKFSEKMKFVDLLEHIVKEALGVPDGILESAEDLYKDILDRLPSLKNKIDTSKNEFRLEFDNSTGYKIGDLVIKYVSVTFRLKKNGRYLLNGYAVNPHLAPELNLYIDLIVPTNWNFNEVIYLLISKEKKIVPSISHELMHVYDFYKRKHYNISGIGKYNVRNSDVFSKIYPISNFLNLLYFTHSIENVVRPSEFASELKKNKINLKNFLEFLKRDDTYYTLKRAKNFSYEELKNDLKNYIPEIELVIKHFNDVGNTDEDKIDKILEMVRDYVKNNVEKNHSNMVFFDVIGKTYGDKGRSMGLNKVIKTIGKFNSNDAFYKNEEKIFNEVGDKMIRKLSKLYDTTYNNNSFYGKLIKKTLTKEELNVDGDLNLSNTNIKSLPKGLEVSGDLNLIGCTKLESLPSDLKVGKDIWLTGTPIAKKYTKEQFKKGRKKWIEKIYPGVFIKRDVYL